MSSFEWNKIFGAVLGAILCATALGHIAKEVTHVHEPEKRGYFVEVEEAPAPGVKKKVGPDPIAPLLLTADVEAGMKVFKKCAACHTPNEGGANTVGPNLWNIVGTQMAANGSFAYSNVMKEMGGVWGYEELNKLLYKPSKYIPGTKMSFVGLKKDKDRANVIAYLRSLSNNPQPLPEVTEEAPAADAEATTQGQ